MNSNQRGPILFFGALFGLVFLCLCLVVAGVGFSRLTDELTASPARTVPATTRTLPVPTSAPRTSQPAIEQVTSPAIVIEPGADVETEILRTVYQKVNPAVVKVINLASAAVDTETEETFPQGQGSGFVWDAAGHIVTNAHVVEGADEVQVVFFDDRVATGEVLGSDFDSDLAVIVIDPSNLDLVIAERGNLDEVQVGDRAIAIGAPFDFAGSMTVGTVSGLGRSIRSLNYRYVIPEVIQTDAPINPGNSGGPLLNSRGQVIGINAQIRTESNVRANSGVGFAIPIYIAERVVPALIDTGRFEHAYLGIQGQSFSPEWAEALNLDPATRGVYVFEAVAGGPAAKAGIRSATRETDVVTGVNTMTEEPIYLYSGGDLITAINDWPVQRFDDLLIYLFRNASPGDTVQLSVIHADGSQELVPVQLGARPAQ